MHTEFAQNFYMSVIHVARLLGIDVQNEPQYLWIAQQASQAQLESEEWKEFTNEQGKTMYYNIKSKVCVRLYYSFNVYIENTSNSSCHCKLFAYISAPKRFSTAS